MRALKYLPGWLAWRRRGLEGVRCWEGWGWYGVDTGGAGVGEGESSALGTGAGGVLGYTAPERLGKEQGAGNTQPRPVSWMVGSQCWGAGCIPWGGASRETSHLMRTHPGSHLDLEDGCLWGGGAFRWGGLLRLQETLCSLPGVKCLVHERECEHARAWM